MFVWSCITHLGDRIVMIPQEEIPYGASGNPSTRRLRATGNDINPRLALNALTPCKTLAPEALFFSELDF
jgi:hypothetical protein